ncbi:MAG: lysophospholipid acyltransferase family protein [Gemmatimonadaceae bacterium]
MTEQNTSLARTGSGLTRVESFNVRLVELWHTVPALSSISTWLGRNVARREFELLLGNLLEEHNFERLRDADYDKSILVCANHRSYVDNFAVAIRAMKHIPPNVRLIAPARTEGLFDKPWGIFVNFFLTFMNMYPPVIRSSRGAMWGKRVIQILTDLLLKGRLALFIHPEGGRNKGSDPYDLMPAKPGLGKIIHQSKATVFPVFLQGFPRSPKAFIRANYGKGASSQPLVHAVMGEPLDFSAERALPASPEVYRAIGRRLMDAIVAASAEEKEIRRRANSKTP